MDNFIFDPPKWFTRIIIAVDITLILVLIGVLKDIIKDNF